MIYEEKIESSDPRLARHIYHDSRSKDFMFDTTGLEIIDVEHKRLIPVFDQGLIGSCTGNAGNGDINTEPFPLNSHIYTPDEAGALKLYQDAQVIDGVAPYPANDNGSSGLSIAKALLKNGIISSYQHTFTLNDALKALGRYPIITGINWYEGMYKPDTDGRVHIQGVIKGGHEIQAYKVDTKLGRIWFYNSWGDQWGVKGTFYLTWEDYATLLSQGGDVTVLIPLEHVDVVPTTWKYFKSGEFTNSEHTHTVAELKVELVNMLDKARGIAGVPFVITSGYRTVAENSKVGGVDGSSHTKGLAVDIAVTTKTRQSILRGLLTCGIPVFIEDAVIHIHVDIDSSIHKMGDAIISIKD